MRPSIGMGPSGTLRPAPPGNNWAVLRLWAEAASAGRPLCAVARLSLKLGAAKFSLRRSKVEQVPVSARIFKPAKTAMQSGYARTREWVLVHEPALPREIDPLMGWTSSADTAQQVRLEFDTKEEAIAYAERNGIPYALSEPKPRANVRKSYADNFKFGRLGSWTH